MALLPLTFKSSISHRVPRFLWGPKIANMPKPKYGVYLGDPTPWFWTEGLTYYLREPMTGRSVYWPSNGARQAGCPICAGAIDGARSRIGFFVPSLWSVWDKGLAVCFRMTTKDQPTEWRGPSILCWEHLFRQNTPRSTSSTDNVWDVRQFRIILTGIWSQQASQSLSAPIVDDSKTSELPVHLRLYAKVRCSGARPCSLPKIFRVVLW